MSLHEEQDEHPRKRIRLESSSRSPKPSQDLQVGGSGLQKTKPTTDDSPEDSQIAKELRAGIAAYINPDAPGFSGVLKQRYTDFLVNEILPSGQVLHLDSIKAPSHKKPTEVAPNVETSAGPKEQRVGTNTNEEGASQDGNSSVAPAEESSTNTEEARIDRISDEQRQTLHKLLGENTTHDILKLAHAVLEFPQRKPKEFRNVTSQPIPDKDDRTQAHIAIRNIFESRFESASADDKTIIVSVNPPVRQKVPNINAKQGQRGQRPPRWDELGGHYLHFTLYKENKDTMEVMYYLASQTKVPVKKFQFAGTKDRRAVTVQRVSVYRMRAEHLAHFNRSLRGSKVGGFEYSKNGLELGQLTGNEFVITLRDCHFPGEEGLSTDQRLDLANQVLQEIIPNLSKSGFINYYGLQRFGSFSTTTDAVGVKLLQEDLQGAVADILSYTPEALAAALDENNKEFISYDDKSRAHALYIWETTGDAPAAIAKLPKKFSAEANMIKHLGWQDRNSGEYRRRQDWQGALSNIQRNLRLMYVHAYQSLVWNEVAGRRWKLFGSKVVEGDLVLTNEHKDKELGLSKEEDEVDEQGEIIIKPGNDDSAADADGTYERARALTKEEVDRGKYDIFDIVLPLPGYDVEYPKNAIGEYYKEFMGSEKGGKLDPHNMRRKWKDISLSGGYRKLLGRPGAVQYEVKVYKGEAEQLVETDLEKLERIRKEGAANAGTKDETGSKDDGERMEADEQDDDIPLPAQETATQKLAVVLRMQLGSSQYATMALRELMKAGGVQTYKPDFGSGR